MSIEKGLNLCTSLSDNLKVKPLIIKITNSDDTKAYFDLLSSLIPSSTELHFFSTIYWMYPSIEQFNTNNEQFPIEESIKQIVDGTNTKVIPVGRAFKLFNDKYPHFFSIY